MQYQNPQIDTGQLPSITNLQYEKLEKTYLYVQLASLSGTFFFLFIIVTVASASMPPEVPDLTAFLMWGWLLLFIISISFTMMGFRYKMYAMRQRDIIYRSGWFWRSLTVVPFVRVQHVEIAQGPIERQFGLSKLKIYTAGGSSSDLTIPGLSNSRATGMKNFIVGKTAEDEEE